MISIPAVGACIAKLIVAMLVVPFKMQICGVPVGNDAKAVALEGPQSPYMLQVILYVLPVTQV